MKTRMKTKMNISLRALEKKRRGGRGEEEEEEDDDDEDDALDDWPSERENNTKQDDPLLPPRGSSEIIWHWEDGSIGVVAGPHQPMSASSHPSSTIPSGSGVSPIMLESSRSQPAVHRPRFTHEQQQQQQQPVHSHLQQSQQSQPSSSYQRPPQSQQLPQRQKSPHPQNNSNIQTPNAFTPIQPHRAPNFPLTPHPNARRGSIMSPPPLLASGNNGSDTMGIVTLFLDHLKSLGCSKEEQEELSEQIDQMNTELQGRNAKIAELEGGVKRRDLAITQLQRALKREEIYRLRNEEQRRNQQRRGIISFRQPMLNLEIYDPDTGSLEVEEIANPYVQPMYLLRR
ncbi:hypothetical protein TWF281_002722 [Arthrobotrys megalospora]